MQAEPVTEGKIMTGDHRHDGKPDDPRGNPKLRESVEKAVPQPEKLPRGPDENPLSEQVRETTEKRQPGPGRTTFEGGDEVEK